MQLRGCGTALVTPFRQDGSIDDAALRNLVAWQIEAGIDFLVPCGTTGETPTLTHDEWLYVIDTTIEVAAGRVPIVAGATSNSTHEAVQKAQEIAITLEAVLVTHRASHSSRRAPVQLADIIVRGVLADHLEVGPEAQRSAGKTARVPGELPA